MHKGLFRHYLVYWIYFDILYLFPYLLDFYLMSLWNTSIYPYQNYTLPAKSILPHQEVDILQQESCNVKIENKTYNPLRLEEHTSELQSRQYIVCRLLLEK